MLYRLLLLTLVPSTLLAQAPDPTISIAKCTEPKEPFGHYQVTGIIRTVLSPSGEADTTRIEVGSSDGLSPAGLRSVAARQLASCRFRIDPRPRQELVVLQQFVADSGHLTLRTIPAGNRAFTPQALEVPPPPEEPVNSNDPALDEAPRQLNCKMREKMGPTMTVEGPLDLQRAQRELERNAAGDVSFTFVVGADGRFVEGSAVMESSTNPNITQDGMKVYESCRYAPGRIGGRPVAVRMKGRLIATAVITGP